VFTAGTDEMVDQLNAVIQEQREEVKHLQNMLENLTAQHRAYTGG